ncbi:gag-pol polyprotein [Tanacetum coccineum]
MTSSWTENAIAISLQLADGVLSSIEEKKTAKEIWDHLARLYEARTLHNKFFLKRKLYALRMTESTSVTEHVNNLNALFSQLTSLDYCLVFDDVAASILEEENRRNNREDMQTSSRQVEALTVTRGRSMERGSSGSHNHGKSKTGKKKNNFKCFKCGKQGHFKKDCRGSNTSNPQGHVASTLMMVELCALVLMRGEKVAANLYQLEGEIIEEAEASVASHSPSHKVAGTWHQKLGHMSEQGMKILMERKLIPRAHKNWFTLCVALARFFPGRSKFLYLSLMDYSRDVGCIKSEEVDVFEVFKSYKAQGSNQKAVHYSIYPQPEWSGREVMTDLVRKEARAFDVKDTDGWLMWTEKNSDIQTFIIYGIFSTVGMLVGPCHESVVSRDVVFMEDKVQENEESDSTTKETTTIQMEKEFQSNDSSEAIPQHEVNETTESQAPTTRTSDRERRRPGWKSDYVMESNVAYCLLTEEGEPSTLQEALNNPDASFGEACKKN